MGKKAKATLYIDNEVVREAKALGLNLSVVSENAIREAVSALKRSKGADCPKTSDNPTATAPFQKECGPGGTRTRDLRLAKPTLYH